MALVKQILLSIGVDLGQRRDPTAVVVCELINLAAAEAEPRWHYEVRHMERLPLGTTYPQVAERVERIYHNAVQTVRQREIERTHQDPSVSIPLFLDATGAVPALDMFRERGLEVTACFFNHGDRRTETDNQVTIGKAWLVNRLQALAQNDRLHLPAHHPDASAMMRELMDYEIKIDQNANDRYGAFKTGTHDDMVTSLGLAVQWTPADMRWMDDLTAYFDQQFFG